MSLITCLSAFIGGFLYLGCWCGHLYYFHGTLQPDGGPVAPRNTFQCKMFNPLLSTWEQGRAWFPKGTRDHGRIAYCSGPRSRIAMIPGILDFGHCWRGIKSQYSMNRAEEFEDYTSINYRYRVNIFNCFFQVEAQSVDRDICICYDISTWSTLDCIFGLPDNVKHHCDISRRLLVYKSTLRGIIQ